MTLSRSPIPPEAAGTLFGLLAERVKRSPEREAYRYFDDLSERWVSYTWLESYGCVLQWRRGLESKGLKRGERVAIWLPNSINWPMMDLASHSLGLVVVPIYAGDRAENVEYMLRDSGATLLLLKGSDEVAKLEPLGGLPESLRTVVSVEPASEGYTLTGRLGGRLESLEDFLFGGGGPDGEGPEGEDLGVGKGEGGGEVTDLGFSESVATIVYTSGTTGRPKGVELTHRNILWNASAAIDRVSAHPEDTFLSFLPLSHTFERTVGYYLPIMAGSSVAYARGIETLSDDILTVRPTVLISVPRLFEKVYMKIQDSLSEKGGGAKVLFKAAVAVGWKRFLCKRSRGTWSPSLLLYPALDSLVGKKVREKLGGRLRVAVSGGAPLQSKIASFFLSLGINLVEGYGMTESAPIIAANSIEENMPGSVGRALDSVEVKISPDGELLVRSPGVMKGYHNNIEATREVIDKDGWLHTGDKARVEEGFIYIVGRIKEILVLSSGEKVPPGDIETGLQEDPLIDQSVVIGEGRPYLSALLVLAEGAREKIREEIGGEGGTEGKRIEEYLIERIKSKMEEFPGFANLYRVTVLGGPLTIEDGLLTPTQKVRRGPVAERFAAEIEGMYEGH